MSIPFSAPTASMRAPLWVKIFSIGIVGIIGLLLVAAATWVGSSAMTDAAARRDVHSTVIEKAGRLSALDERLWNTQMMYVLAVNKGRWDAARDDSPQRSEFLKVLNEKRALLQSFPTDGLSGAQRDAVVRLTELNDEFTAAERRGAELYQVRNRAAGAREIDASRVTLADSREVIAGLSTETHEQARRAAEELQVAGERQRRIALVGLPVVSLLLIALAWVIARSLTHRLNDLRDSLTAIASGDLTQASLPGPRDEIGEAATAVDATRESVRQVLVQVSSATDAVAEASAHVITAVAARDDGVERSTADLEAATGTSDAVSTSVQTVAAGTEQMITFIREIAKSATDAADIAAAAVEAAERTNDTIARLGASSAEIGQVIQAVTSVAEQTNLLALNATIEAARAGEAGKGFAVVAGEVKDLAQETAQATEDIGRRIEAIQADTKAAVLAISEIGDIIARINDTQAAIAGAVEEQTATTDEMGRSIAEAASGARSISERIVGASQIARQSIGTSQDAVAATARLSDQVHGIRAVLRRYHY